MPGRPLPPPTEVVAFPAAGVRVCWWDADLIVQRSIPGGWRTAAIVERDPTVTRTRAQVRTAMRTTRDQLTEGATLYDHAADAPVRWDGTSWQTEVT